MNIVVATEESKQPITFREAVFSCDRICYALHAVTRRMTGGFGAMYNFPRQIRSRLVAKKKEL